MEKKNIYETIIAVMNDVNAISKGQVNTQQHFKYRGIDDVMNELHPAMAKNGLFVAPTVLSEERGIGKTSSGKEMASTRLKIQFTFYASDGSHIETVVIGEAQDMGDKASNKALSIGLKYALLQVLCIPTEDEKDPDARSYDCPKVRPVLKGGDSTPAEAKKISDLLQQKDPTGKNVFSREQMLNYSAMRKDKTAAEVIEIIKADLERINQSMEPPATRGQPQGFDELQNVPGDIPQDLDPGIEPEIY